MACCRRASPPSRDRSAMRSTAYSNLMKAGVEVAQVSTQCVRAVAEQRKCAQGSTTGRQGGAQGMRAQVGWRRRPMLSAGFPQPGLTWAALR